MREASSLHLKIGFEIWLCTVRLVYLQQYDMVNLTVFNSTGHLMRKVCQGTVLDQNRVMTSASCLELNKYLLDPNRDAKHLHFEIDFGNETRRNITYFVSHPGYHYAKVETM